jgi:hypothetical protein
LEFFSSANSTIFANFIVKFRHNFDTEKRKLKRWWGAGEGVLLGAITFRFRLHICGWVLEFGKEARANFAPQAFVCVSFASNFLQESNLLQRKNASSGAAHLLAPAWFSCACLKPFLLGFLSLDH